MNDRILRVARSGSAARQTALAAVARYSGEVNFVNVAENLRESFRSIAASRSAGEVRELHGVSIASASVTFQMFNAAFLSEPVASETELMQRILLPALHFDTREREWAYWVCEDWLAARARKRLRTAMERVGLRHSVDLPGMVAETILPPVRPLAAVRIERVSGERTRNDFCAIGATCFHVPLPWFHEVFDNLAVFERFRSYVGYVDGEAVSTTALVEGGGALGVYNVATLPGHPCQGYGESVMRQAMEDARREVPLEPTVLQSTPAGLRLYERMGFHTVTRFGVYAS